MDLGWLGVSGWSITPGGGICSQGRVEVGRCLTRLVNHLPGMAEIVSQGWRVGVSVECSITPRGWDVPQRVGMERCFTMLVNKTQEVGCDHQG